MKINNHSEIEKVAEELQEMTEELQNCDFVEDDFVNSIQNKHSRLLSALYDDFYTENNDSSYVTGIDASGGSVVVGDRDDVMKLRVGNRNGTIEVLLTQDQSDELAEAFSSDN